MEYVIMKECPRCGWFRRIGSSKAAIFSRRWCGRCDYFGIGSVYIREETP